MRCALWPDDSDAWHRQEVSRFFAGELREPLATLIAVDGSGGPVGFAELSIRPYAEDCVTDRVAYLEGWYVVPESRRRGVGRALVDAAEDWARAQGCAEFASDALLDNHVSPRQLASGTVLLRCFRKVIDPSKLPAVLLAAAVVLAGCAGGGTRKGEKLARTYCAACHAFPEPSLLDKNTWQTGVLPQMAPRLGVSSGTLYSQVTRDPHMTVLTRPVSRQDWDKIVAYYLATAPDSLPYQSLPAEPQLDPPFFKTGPFVPRLQSSAVITLLHADSTHHRIIMGEAGTNVIAYSIEGRCCRRRSWAARRRT
jgi:aminoglycoside 6'-N-acetyltransferase I